MDPIGATSYIDAETGALLRAATESSTMRPTTRHGRCSQPRRRSTTRRATPASSGAGPSRAVGPAASRRSRTAHRRRPGTSMRRWARSWFLTRGNNARATEKWISNVGNEQGINYAASADARLRLPVDEPVVRGALQPGRVHVARSGTTSTRRARTCSRCTTACTTGRTTSASPRRRSTRRRSTSARGGLRERPRARQRPGRRHRRRAARVPVARQRQPVHAARRGRRR